MSDEKGPRTYKRVEPYIYLLFSTMQKNASGGDRAKPRQVSFRSKRNSGFRQTKKVKTGRAGGIVRTEKKKEKLKIKVEGRTAKNS